MKYLLTPLMLLVLSLYSISFWFSIVRHTGINLIGVIAFLITFIFCISTQGFNRRKFVLKKLWAIFMPIYFGAFIILLLSNQKYLFEFLWHGFGMVFMIEQWAYVRLKYELKNKNETAA